jgi:phospholipase D1/2
MNQLVWIRMSVVLALAALAAAVWKWLPVAPHDLSSWLAPHRHAWYALPMVMLGFIVLGVLPVILLIAATGLAFGPVLGPLFAMAGCLASASVGFAIGRRLGLGRIEQWGGDRVARVARGFARNGTLATFFVRKVPAPFFLANIVVGASRVRFRDFILGTILGMGAFVVAIAGSGHHLTQALHDPSPSRWARAALMIGVPLALAWLINRALQRPRDAA